MRVSNERGVRVYDDNGVLIQEWNDAGREFYDAVANTARPYTEEENVEADARVANKAALLDKAATALENNADFLANGSPTTAEAVAQVRALTRQVNALIRLEVEALDSTDGS